jgi:hypothetical protein
VVLSLSMFDDSAVRAVWAAPGRRGESRTPDIET